MQFTSTRRRFMELAGASATLSLAGCESLDKIGSSGDGTAETDSPADMQSTGTDTPSSTTATVTVGIQPDQQQLQQRQQEIQTALESGNITRSEARQQYQSAQLELLADAITEFRQQATSKFELTVEGSVRQAGAVLVTGPAADVIGLLSLERVRGLFSESTFDRIQSRARTDTATDTGTPSG